MENQILQVFIYVRPLLQSRDFAALQSLACCNLVDPSDFSLKSFESKRSARPG